MKPDEVERLLGRFTPDAAPLAFKERVLGEARKSLLRQAPPRPASPRIRMAGIFAVAVSLLIAAGVFRIILFPGTASAPGTEKGSLSPQEEKQALDLVKRLADDKPETRESAERDLKRMGRKISDVLREELKRNPDAEVRIRLKRILDELVQVSLEHMTEVDLGDNLSPQEVAWRPDGKEIALSVWTRDPALPSTLRIFNPETGTRSAKIDLPNRARRLAYSPHGNLLGVRHDRGVELYESGTYRKLAELALEPDVNLMTGGLFAFLDDQRLIFGAHRGSEELLEIATYQGGKLTAAVKGRGGFDWNSPTCSPNGAWFIQNKSGNGLTFDLVDLRTWTKLSPLASKPEESKRVMPDNDKARYALTDDGWTGCAFSQDSRRLFLQSPLGELVVYDVGSWQKTHWADLGKSCFFDVLGEKYLVTARKSESVLHVWRWDTGGEVCLEPLAGMDVSKIELVRSCPEAALVCVLVQSSPKVRIYRLKEKP